MPATGGPLMAKRIAFKSCDAVGHDLHQEARHRLVGFRQIENRSDLSRPGKTPLVPHLVT
jgi:hypothetical protein